MKRKVSLFVTLIMLFNIIMSFNVYANTNSTVPENQCNLISAVSNSKENQGVIKNHEINKQNMEIGNILFRVKKYSSATAKEKDVVSNYYNLDKKLLKQCENMGYSLNDSVYVLNTLKDSDFTMDDVKVMEKKNKNLYTGLHSIEKYKKVKDSKKFSTEEMKSLRVFIMKIKKFEENEEKGSLNNSSETQSIPSIVTTKAGISTILKSAMSTANKDTFMLQAAPSLSAAQAFYLSETPENQPVQQYDPPFDIDKNVKEYVNPYELSFNFQETDLWLPGRNGLDLKITSKYSSNDSKIIRYKWKSHNNPNIDDSRYVVDDPAQNHYLENTYGMGVGWSLGFSSIEIIGTNTKTLIFHLADGTIRSQSTLTTKDIIYYADAGSFRNGEVTSAHVLQYKDGKKEFFTADGSLIGIVDRYGNTIKFNYTYIYGYSNVSYKLISKIIDTLGRVVNISYNFTDTERIITITSPNGSMITYQMDKINQPDRFLLKKKTDGNGRQTTFNYGVVNDDQTGTNTIMTQITYPTGAISKNTYDGNVILSSNEHIDKGTTYNHKTYTSTVDGKFISDGVKTIQYAYTNGLKTGETIRDNSNNILQQTTYTYYMNKFIDSITTTSYNESKATITRVTKGNYNEYGDLLQYTDELGRVSTYQYADPYHVKKQEEINKSTANDKGIVTEYQVDSATGNVLNKKQWPKNYGDAATEISIQYGYDIYGNVISESTKKNDGSYISKSYEYDPAYQNAYLTKKIANIKDYTGAAYIIMKKISYDYNTGNKTSTMDGKGNVTSYQYDLGGRLKMLTHPDGKTIAVDYNDAQNICTVTDENGFPMKKLYDGLGRPFQVQQYFKGALRTTKELHFNTYGQNDWIKDANGNAASFAYDPLGRIVRITNPDGTFKTVSYDDAANLNIETDEDGNPHYSNYDLKGNLISETIFQDKNNLSNGNAVTYTYDANDEVKSKKDANGNETDCFYDGIGRLQDVKTVEAAPKVEHYEYDVLNNVSSIVTPGGSIIQRVYDELGRLIKETDPAGRMEYTAYDAAGNVIKKVDKNGQATTFTYDNRNRVKIKNTGSINVSYSYDNVGNLLTATDSSGITSYQYFENGSLMKETLPDQKSIAYDYDLNGNRISVTDHFGKVTGYGYDNRNRMKTVTVDGMTTTYDYNNNGTKKAVTYPSGVKEEFQYDSVNNLLNLKNKKADGRIINQFGYSYDKVGNQLTKSDVNGVSSYTYDNLNRVKTVAEPNGFGTNYGYDGNGNIKNKKVSNTKNEILDYTYQYDVSNRLEKISSNQFINGSTLVTTSTSDYVYDGNGNQTEVNKKTINNGKEILNVKSKFKYNELNQLITYTSGDNTQTTYAYDTIGLRKSKTTGANTTGYYYDGDHVIIETANGALNARNILGTNVIGRQNAQGTSYFSLYNGHGDVMNLVDGAGNVQNSYDYDIYGKEKIAMENAMKNPVRYAGEYQDEESSLYYLRGRYYSPDTMTFISEDSYKGEIGDPLSLNLYTYCKGNPVKYVDPSGHWPWDSNFKQEVDKAILKVGVAVYVGTKVVVDTVVDKINAGLERALEKGAALLEKEATVIEGASNTAEYASSAAQYERLINSLAKEEIQSVIKTTEHGAERLMSRGFSPSEISGLKLSPNKIMSQADGASVYIKNVTGGKFNLIVESENGVVTALKNISQKSLDKLAKNYGWK